MSYRFLAGKRSPVDGVDVTLMTDGNSMQGSPSRNHTSYRSSLWTEHGQYRLPAQLMEKRRALEAICARADIKQCTLRFIAAAAACTAHAGGCGLQACSTHHAACRRPTRELRALRTRSLNGMQRTGPGRVPIAAAVGLAYAREASTWGC
jgi:hypothetical protein